MARSKVTPSFFLRRSAPLKLINGIGKLSEQLGVPFPGLDADRILQKARERTGIELELPEMERNLRFFLRSVLEEAQPNTFGRLSAYNLSIQLASGRLQIESHWRQHPAVGEERIEKPVFILGLPRTGTTILHALLDRDPGMRSPLCWECLQPYPVPQPATYENDPRIRLIEKQFDRFFRLVPNFQSMHLMHATAPQECIALHALHFQSYQFISQFYFPSYLQWYEAADKVALYRVQKRLLQYYQSGGVRRDRWLLKSPVHLGNLDALFEVFPDARLIVPHRYPRAVIPSATSLISSVRSAYSDTEDPRLSAREQLQTWSRALADFVEQRKNHSDKEAQFFDLYFEDFIQDPLACVRQLYHHFGWPLSPEVDRRMERYMQENPRGKHGAHRYTLEQFGLSEAEIQTAFAGYEEFLAERFPS